MESSNHPLENADSSPNTAHSNPDSKGEEYELSQDYSLNWEQVLVATLARGWRIFQKPLLYFGCLLLSLLIGRCFHYKAGYEEYLLGSGNFYIAIGTLLTGLLLYRDVKGRKVHFLKDVPLFPKQYEGYEKSGISFGKAFLALLSGLAAGGVFAALLLFLFGEDRYIWFMRSGHFLQHGADKPLAALMWVLPAVFLEEVLFRGYMFSAAFSITDYRKSLLLVSVTYGLFHLGGGFSLIDGFLSAALIELFMREECLIYGILLHTALRLPMAIVWLHCAA